MPIKSTFVLVHGAWHGGKWFYREIATNHELMMTESVKTASPLIDAGLSA